MRRCSWAPPVSGRGSAQGIDPALLEFLAEQPHRRYLDLAGKRLLLIHSTPWEPRGEYVHPHSAKLDRFAEADADIVLYGHTHCQVVKRVGERAGDQSRVGRRCAGQPE